MFPVSLDVRIGNVFVITAIEYVYTTDAFGHFVIFFSGNKVTALPPPSPKVPVRLCVSSKC